MTAAERRHADYLASLPSDDLIEAQKRHPHPMMRAELLRRGVDLTAWGIA